MLVLNLPFKALMFLTLMRPSLVLFLVLWIKLVKDFLKVRCRLALLPFLISLLIWLDLVASLPLIKERILVIILLLLFFFIDPATTQIYTLSLHDALPIWSGRRAWSATSATSGSPSNSRIRAPTWRDRKSTRLNSSHVSISYAVF